MNERDKTILHLKREAAGEIIDLALTHLAWAARHLSEERDERATQSFSFMVKAVREVAPLMKEIEAATAARAQLGEAASEYRAQRGRKAVAA